METALFERGMEEVLRPAQACGEESLRRLTLDLEQVDWNMLDRQIAALREPTETLPGTIAPPILFPASTDETQNQQEAREAGFAALQAGRVAIATVAGGQASRLGFEGPKGAFPLGAISGASLFQMLAGQIQRIRVLTKANLQWIIQTGPGNHIATAQFLQARNWFGLGASSVHLVCQGTLPALSPTGQFLLSTPRSLFRNPDGHGGFYQALKDSIVLPQLRDQGVDLLYYCQVDNPLARVADPIFLGHHLRQKAQMSVKVIEKKDPAEKVGLIVQRDEKVTCLEYSDLPEGFAEQRAKDGGLRFRAGNIAIHFFDLAFAEEMAEAALPLHLAHKEVHALHAGSAEAVPCQGIKFETFVFDALSLADVALVQNCEREEEFAPVKNRTGADSIQSSREALDFRVRKWMAQADGPTLSSGGLAEMAPNVCYDQQDLAARIQDVRLNTKNLQVIQR